MTETQLYDIFRAIISKSKKMKRFVAASGKGSDLNKNNLGEKLTDALGGISDGVKYPLVLMFPPLELPNYNIGWSTFRFNFYFIDKQWQENGKQAKTNSFNNLSQKKIEENWEEMAKCAKDFRMAFTMLTDANLDKGVRTGDEKQDYLERFSFLGNDVVAGVGLAFVIDLWNDCTVSDYDFNDIKNLLA